MLSGVDADGFCARLISEDLDGVRMNRWILVRDGDTVESEATLPDDSLASSSSLALQ